MDGFQEFVKSGSIRNQNKNTFCTVEMLVQIFWLEEPRVRLQEEQCHAQAETKDQGCWTEADDGHPTEYAGSSEQRAHATEDKSLQHQNCPSSETNSGQPPDSGEHTEELWQTDEDQPVWTLKLEPKPPKVKKPARRRRRNCQRQLREYTMDDEYDDEEIRMTPQGLCLFRLFGSRWVAMA
ncbi:hypothetical protein D4764_09G0009370 [Takifugu flavidus]|uniref:Uncharacterized protein n=1 Tax=Takifugu flavidus TaxID=433684 RepID=A0A5C6MR95_9TELE|nr:hypothetical protein D4764_09G0009370 [Takifugu flavidus]